MTRSSDDESKSSGKLIDLRDRLPPRIFGDNSPAADLAAEIVQLLAKTDHPPEVHLAALQLASFFIQKLWREQFGRTEDDIRRIFEESLLISENYDLGYILKGEEEPR